MGLYETAATIRRLVVLTILGLIVLIILVGTFNFLRDLYRKLNPPPEPAPTVGFGKLPRLQLPSLTMKGTPTFLLETATGELPSFPDRAVVVAMKEIPPSLLGEQRAKNLAEQFDFSGEGELSKDKKSIIFRDKTDKRTLTVNLTTQLFTLATDLGHIEKTVPKGRALTSAQATSEGQEFLSRNGLLKGEFGEGRQTTQVHRVVNGKARDALSASEGQFTRVDFFRNLTGVSAESFPILPPSPKIGMIQMWVTSGLEPKINNILYLSYTVWEVVEERVDKETVKKKTETYPLRPVSSAWEEVKTGKGIAELLAKGSSPLDPYTPLTLKTISIRKVQLAYFDDSSWQRYLQPIYVFSGSAKTTDGKEADFTAYRPAVSDDWIQQL